MPRSVTTASAEIIRGFDTLTHRAQQPHLPRRGDRSQSMRSIHSLSLADHPAAGARHEVAGRAATQAAPPYRIRIGKLEVTLLHHKHAPDPPASCGFFQNLLLIPGHRVTIQLAGIRCQGRDKVSESISDVFHPKADQKASKRFPTPYPPRHLILPTLTAPFTGFPGTLRM